MRATVSGETSRLLRLAERLEELGCSTRITSAGSSWVVNLRRELGDSLQRLPRSSALKIASSTMFTAQMMIVAQTASMKLPIEKGPTIQLVM